MTRTRSLVRSHAFNLLPVGDESGSPRSLSVSAAASRLLPDQLAFIPAHTCRVGNGSCFHDDLLSSEGSASLRRPPGTITDPLPSFMAPRCKRPFSKSNGHSLVRCRPLISTNVFVRRLDIHCIRVATGLAARREQSQNSPYVDRRSRAATQRHTSTPPTSIAAVCPVANGLLIR